MPDFPFDIARLSADHILNKFSTGDVKFAPLKAFLIKQAFDYKAAMVATTYVVIAPNSSRVIGYITLTCSEIELGNGYTIEDCPHVNRYPTMPALKIARLAVDKAYRGQRIGEALVDLAIAIALEEIAPQAGCRFVVTDAKQEAIAFYLRQGFTFLDSEDNRAKENPVMFMDLKTLA